MQPASEATKLETPEGIKEYEGSGKLKGKKALITGGECVFNLVNVTGIIHRIQG